MLGASTRRRLGVAVGLLVLVAAFGVAETPSLAGPAPKKSFTAAVSPTSIGAGGSVSGATLVVTYQSGNGLGSARFTVPGGLTVTGAPTASKTIVANARKGCTSAMATIFLLAGSWTMLGDRDRKTLEKATAIISSSDGWEVFKEDW